MKQGSQESNGNYLAHFKTNVATIELTGGKHIFVSPTISGIPIEEMSSEEFDEEVDKSKAIIFLECTDNGSFSALSKRLKEATYLDRYEYPTLLATMYELMTKSCTNILPNNNNNASKDRQAGVSLLQRNESNGTENVPGTDGRTFDIICYNCNRRGHYASCCPNSDNRVGISNLQYGCMMKQTEIRKGLIPPDWILLDTCSTDNVVHDLSLLTNIKDCMSKEEMKIHANGGSLCYKTTGLFKYLPVQCYHNSDSIAKVLLLKSVADIRGYNITMDTNNGPHIYVRSGNSKLLFQ